MEHSAEEGPMSVEVASTEQGNTDASRHEDNVIVHNLSVLSNPGLGYSWQAEEGQPRTGNLLCSGVRPPGYFSFLK